MTPMPIFGTLLMKDNPLSGSSVTVGTTSSSATYGELSVVEVLAS